MKIGTMKKSQVLVMGIALALILAIGGQWGQPVNSQSPTPRPVDVHVETIQELAAPGNTGEARIIVVVGDRTTGLPITTLSRANFLIENFHRFPAGACGFGPIISVANAGSGAYSLKVKPSISGCVWGAGDYLFWIRVSAGSVQGVAAGKLTVK
jgi:hypothetical protein